MHRDNSENIKPSLVRQSLAIALIVILIPLVGPERVSAQGPTSGSVTVGKPWRGAPGITQTIAQINAREKSAPQKESPLRSRTRRFHQTPKAPKLPAGLSPRPSLPSALLMPLSPQPIGTSFLGVQISESGFYPPDSMGDVGPTQVLFAENGRVKSFSKSGVLGILNVSLDNFFAALSPCSFCVGDPNVRYDRLSSRWFVTALDFDSPERLFIAVSSSAILTDATGFTFFQFQPDAVGGSPTGAQPDYDSLGVDKFALYIGVNMFGGTNNFETAGFVVNKSDLLTSALTVTPFRSLSVCNPGCSNGPSSPRGVANDDPNATEGYFIGLDIISSNQIAIRRITYTLGITPSISSNIFVPISANSYPIDVPALGSTTPIDAIGNDLFNAQIHKNQLSGATSLWTAHNIEVNSSGVSTSGGGRNGSRWYEINNLTTTPMLNQSGTLYDSAASNPRSFWVPSVAMSGQGHMALGSSFASVNDYAGIAVAGRLSGDPLGSTRSATIAQNGLGPYNIVEPGFGGRNRWGDYSRTVVDPNDNMTMWTFQEYANATNSWGVRAVQLKAPPPALPISTSPSAVALGQPSVSVVITGASFTSAGFFDPGADTGGPGYASHITATVSGGVIVNSVTFHSPTQVTLDLSTVGATNGMQNVIITNPDGQATTGYCLLATGSPSAAQSTCRQIFPLVFR